ncbi:hypothetical protein SLEP1_g53806 [Rubroshorea leprosula]|uniref:Uncharacterized protein n=1 Tax=Rubroshorea leprosula TaxID=152421 RepID=A0AAV5MBC2_9ROSI|nr:hypothetical protein SLEP1_g53806 [Rubroshorea leprosula]
MGVGDYSLREKYDIQTNKGALDPSIGWQLVGWGLLLSKSLLSP